MNTTIDIDGARFLVNGRPTYEGVSWRGRPVEGLLLNSRMAQAIFDDLNPDTRRLWRYPDTGRWDPERNTEEFCRMLPEYRRHGLLAVTVGLQGGGSNYRPEVWDNYINSAFAPGGSFREAWFDRLARVLDAADRCGMVVIVNYFYWKQVAHIPDDETIVDIARRTTRRLLETGRRNVLVDVANESHTFWGRPMFHPDRIHELIEEVKGVEVDGRRLLAGASTAGGEQIPTERWLEAEDITFPHGNGCTPEELTAKIDRIRETEAYRRRERPIVVNKDSVFVENLEAAVTRYASWGYYNQGFGSDMADRMDWTTHGREPHVEALSGYQTLPVNWGINTERKRAFFDTVREITEAVSR